MQNPLISVIVPIYNVEKYLSKCVQSILAQTYTNLEVFLVDDGSPDRCGEMCDEYARQDARIKVIHKPNGGLSDARNVAIDEAAGEWITFVDSDDYLSVYCIEYLYRNAVKSNAEISVCSFTAFHDNDSLRDTTPSGNSILLCKEKALETMFYQNMFDNTAWGKLYKTALFEGIRYPTDCIIEDCPTTYLLINASKNVAVTKDKLYYYLLRDNSIEGAPFSVKKMDSALKVFEYWNSNKQIVEKIQKAYRCRVISLAFHLLFKVPSNYYRTNEILNTIKQNRYHVMTDKNARLKARIACFVSYFGMPITRLLFKFANRRR